MKTPTTLAILLALSIAACGGDDRPRGTDAGPGSDAGAADAGTPAGDAGVGEDAGTGDAGGADAGLGDAGTDAGAPVDAGSSDAGGGDRTLVEERCARRLGSCTQDSDCTAGGCGGELCASESVASTCDCTAPAATCGCLDGMCAWYR